MKWALRRLDYRQRAYHAAYGPYAPDRSALDAGSITVEGADFRPTVQVTDSSYEARANGFDGAVPRVRQDGRVSVAP